MKRKEKKRKKEMKRKEKKRKEKKEMKRKEKKRKERKNERTKERKRERERQRERETEREREKDRDWVNSYNQKVFIARGWLVPTTQMSFPFPVTHGRDNVAFLVALLMSSLTDLLLLRVTLPFTDEDDQLCRRAKAHHGSKGKGRI